MGPPLYSARYAYELVTSQLSCLLAQWYDLDSNINIKKSYLNLLFSYKSISSIYIIIELVLAKL